MEFTNIEEETKPVIESFDDGIDDELGSINPTVIKIIGCGGGGSSAVQRMIEDGVSGVQFIVLNTDKQALHRSTAQVRVPIGQKITGGLGAGGNPEVGENAAKEDQERIKSLLEGANMVIITAGMGGGTGTGSAPIVAEIAHQAGILTIGVVTTPFDFEGTVRMNNAQTGLEKLKKNVDSLIVLPNDLIFKAVKTFERRLTFKEQFKIADNILCAGARGLTELITKPGEINLDFADLRTVLQNSGDSIIGLGRGKGENKINEAVEGAIANPLLENRQIDGAKRILINISSNGNIALEETKEITNAIRQSADKNASIYFGLSIDENMEDDDIAVTVVATDFGTGEAFGESTPDENEEKTKDDSVFEYGDFLKIIGGNSNSSAPKPAAEEKKPSERISALGLSSIRDTLDPVVKEEQEKPVSDYSMETASAEADTPSEPQETGPRKTFAGRVNPATVDPNDKDVPAIVRKRLQGLSRSIDLTQF